MPEAPHDTERMMPVSQNLQKSVWELQVEIRRSWKKELVCHRLDGDSLTKWVMVTRRNHDHDV